MVGEQKFAAYLEERFEQIRELRRTKGAEYATAVDVHADFRDASESAGTSIEQAIFIYMLKHWRAIAFRCRHGHVKSESVLARIDDMVLYLLLLRAHFEEAENDA